MLLIQRCYTLKLFIIYLLKYLDTFFIIIRYILFGYLLKFIKLATYHRFPQVSCLSFGNFLNKFLMCRCINTPHLPPFHSPSSYKYPKLKVWRNLDKLILRQLFESSLWLSTLCSLVCLIPIIFAGCAAVGLSKMLRA